MKTVNQILRTKGTHIWAIEPNATVFEALQLMADKEIGAVLVMQAGQVIGILSERDYARKIILEGKSSKDTFVREIMTAKVIAVHPKTTVEECMALMTDKHIRHLPVIDDYEIMGVISIGDVVKAIIEEQSFMIDHLTSYITGR